MSNYVGDFTLGSTVYFKFTTVDSSGVSAALASTSLLEAYIDNSSTPSTLGIFLTTDFNARTGLNHVRVVLDSTNNFAAGNDVQVAVQTGLIGAKSAVGYVVGAFSIANRSALRPTVAGRTLDVSAGGEAGVDWANVGSPTTALNLSGTNIDVDQVVASVSGAVGSVAAGGIAAASFAAAAIDAAAIAANAIGSAEVADGFLTAAKFSTGAITSSAVSANYLDAVWNSTIEGTVTARESLRLANSANGGLVSGAGSTSVAIRDLANTKNRVVAAVDISGNRSTITLDLA